MSPRAECPPVQNVPPCRMSPRTLCTNTECPPGHFAVVQSVPPVQNVPLPPTLLLALPVQPAQFIPVWWPRSATSDIRHPSSVTRHLSSVIRHLSSITLVFSRCGHGCGLFVCIRSCILELSNCTSTSRETKWLAGLRLSKRAREVEAKLAQGIRQFEKAMIVTS